MFGKIFTAYATTSVAIFSLLLAKYKYVLLMSGSGWAVCAVILLTAAIAEFGYNKFKSKNELHTKLDEGILSGLGIAPSK